MFDITRSVKIDPKLAEEIINSLPNLELIKEIPSLDADEMLLKGRVVTVKFFGFEGTDGPVFLRTHQSRDVEKLGGGNHKCGGCYMAIPGNSWGGNL